MPMNDRSDEFNEMLAQIAAHVHDIPIVWQKIAIFKELERDEQTEVYIAGCLIGMMSALHDLLRTKEAMDAIQRYVTDCVPRARAIADGWKDEDDSQQSVDTPPDS